MAAKQNSLSAQAIRDKAFGEGAESTAASLLLQILHANEGELEDFREINLGEDCDLDLQHLRECRELLLVLGLALRSSDEALWLRVRESWKQLFWDDGAAPAEQSSAGDAAQHDAGQAGDAPSSPGSERSATPPEPEMLNRPAASAPAEPLPAGTPAVAPLPPAITPPEPPMRSHPWQGSGLVPPQPPLASPAPQPPPAVAPPPVPAAAPPPVPASAPAAGPSPAPTAAPAASGTVDDSDPDAAVLSTASLEKVSPLAGALPFATPDDASAPPSVAAEEASVDAGETAALGALSPLAGMLPFSGEQARPTTGVHPATPATPATPASDQAPASGEPSAPPIELTVEQYAALCATSELPADERSRTETQYGLGTPQDRQILDSHWGARLAADATLQQKFDALLRQYRAWHRSQR